MVTAEKKQRKDSFNVMATVEEAIEEYRAGRFVIIVDDEDRENEGDLTIAAEFVTPEDDQLHGHATAAA